MAGAEQNEPAIIFVHKTLTTIGDSAVPFSLRDWLLVLVGKNVTRRRDF